MKLFARSLPILALFSAAFAQSFPGSIYTPLVAKDNIQTQLTSAMGAADNVAVVQSTTGWASNMVATICETASAMGVCTAGFEAMLVTSTSGANQIFVTRGYGGTTAVAHASGRLVTNTVASVYTTGLNNEVHAIETALGANLSNVPLSPLVSAKTYNFTPLTPGGSLTIGADTITLSPMPAGIAAGSVNVAYLYIAGGTGTAEAVPIIGVSGSTVTVTCAHTHSGAWTIQSATAGGQEALVANGSANVIVVYPGGNYNFYAPLFVSGNNVTVAGAGAGATTITQVTANTNGIVSSPGLYNTVIRDLYLTGSGAQTTSVGIDVGGGVNTGAVSSPKILNVSAVQFATGLRMTAVVSGMVLNSIFTGTGTSGDGIYVTGAGGQIYLTNIQTSPGNGVTGGNRSGLHVDNVIGLYLVNCGFYQSTYGGLFNPGSGQAISNFDMSLVEFDTSNTYAAWFNPTGTGTITTVRSLGGWFSGTVGNDGLRFDPTGGSSSIKGVVIDGAEVYSNTAIGINILGGSNIAIRNSRIAANANGIYVNSTTSTDLTIQGNTIGNNIDGRAGSQITGLTWNPGNSGVITDNTFTGNGTAAVNFSPAAADSVIFTNNRGVDDQLQTIASASSIAIGSGGVPNIKLTGTTTVTTITVGYAGRKIELIAGASITIGGGGNVPFSRSLVANQRISLLSDGTNWY